MPDLGSWLQIISTVAAVLLGTPPAVSAPPDPAFPDPVARFLANAGVVVRDGPSGLDDEPLDGQPPRQLRAIDPLDGPLPDREPRRARASADAEPRTDRDRGDRERRDHERRDRNDRIRDERDRGEARRARQRAARRAAAADARDSVGNAGNGGTARAEANGGAVAIGSVPGGDAVVDGNATVVTTSTEDGVAIEIDASGDVATASQAGADDARSDLRTRRQAATSGEPDRDDADRRSPS